MIKRIVKLSFEPSNIEAFKAIFEESKQAIRAFEGCEHLELLQCLEPNYIFFTYSYWRDANALDAYRNSPLFKATWAKTKVLFNDRPQAWSTELISTPEK